MPPPDYRHPRLEHLSDEALLNRIMTANLGDMRVPGIVEPRPVILARELGCWTVYVIVSKTIRKYLHADGQWLNNHAEAFPTRRAAIDAYANWLLPVIEMPFEATQRPTRTLWDFDDELEGATTHDE